MSFAVFSEENKLLPGVCKPHTGEILSSWLTRLAFYHGLNASEFCMLALSKRFYYGYDIDRTITPEKIILLAEKTNCLPSEIKATSLLWYVDRLFNPENLNNGTEPWLLPSTDVRYPGDKRLHHRSGLMFCPMCLKTKVYFRKEWRLAISFVCPECGCYLVDRCPHCRRGNSFMDIENHDFLKKSLDHYLITCHHCGKDVTECNIEAAPQRILDLQDKFNHLIDHGTSDPIVTRKSYLQVLSFVSRLLFKRFRKGNENLEGFVEDVYQLNGVSYNDHLKFVERNKIAITDLRLIGVKKRADIVSMAHWLLDEWPRRFINLCRNNDVRRASILNLIQKPPAWFREPIYEELVPKEFWTFRRPKNPEQEQYTPWFCVQRTKTVDYNFPIDEPYDEDELYYDEEQKTGWQCLRRYLRTQRFLHVKWDENRPVYKKNTRVSLRSIKSVPSRSIK